jgi:hypothetical protein
MNGPIAAAAMKGRPRLRLNVSNRRQADIPIAAVSAQRAGNRRALIRRASRLNGSPGRNFGSPYQRPVGPDF